jgi:hypothetical protein
MDRTNHGNIDDEHWNHHVSCPIPYNKTSVKLDIFELDLSQPIWKIANLQAGLA